MTVMTPQAVEGLARTLARASAEGLRVSPRGGNTTTEKFIPPFDVDLNIDLTRLNRVIEYEPADLTVSVEAGMTLASLQGVLRARRQFLPLDPPQPERATLGGIIATNASGPLRLRYGTARDWLIGARVMLADGTLVRGGGRVVKNVAGYDMPKLFIGSQGTLGVIVEVTFKLMPLPACSRTLAARFETHAQAAQVLTPLLRSTLLPSALTILDPLTATYAGLADGAHYTLLAQFTGHEAAVARQTREFEARGREQGLVELAPLEGEPEDALWLRVRNLPATLGAYGAVVELSVLPSQLDEAAQAVQAAAGEHDVPCALFSHAGQSLWAALRGEAAPVVEVVAQLREWVAARKGWLVVQHLPAPLKGRLDPWALPRTDREIMRLLKTQFDPQGILNPGVLVGGI